MAKEGRSQGRNWATEAAKAEAHYDLSTAQTFCFKSVRIKVIEATNTRIRYEVLASFPESLEQRGPLWPAAMLQLVRPRHGGLLRMGRPRTQKGYGGDD